jgi:hypothetical protein
MKKWNYVFLVLFLFSFQYTIAQNNNNNCVCCSKAYDEFNFWLGKWNVYDEDNNLIGVDAITAEPDNCLILEKWIDDARRGSSTIFYNEGNNTWNLIWVDNDDFILKLKGNLVNDIMTLKSDLVTSGTLTYYNQITWTQNNDGSVTQLWERYNEHNSKISQVFIGIYKKTLN